MDRGETLISEIKRFKTDLAKYIPIKKMILFGSQARGNIHKWSDVDLIIVSDKFRNKKPYKRIRGFYDYWNINKPVDFLCYTPEEFNKLKKQITIVREAVEHGIEI